MKRLFVVISLVSITYITVIPSNSAEYGPKNYGMREVDSVSLFSEPNPPTLLPRGEFLTRWIASSYPTDPTGDIDWLEECEFSGVDSIQCAFNNARQTENTQLGTSLPDLTLPSQGEWDTMSDGAKALWFINQERSDRGVDPLDNIEYNVTEVAQTYADCLLATDCYGHFCDCGDGGTPIERLEDNPAIASCHDDLPVAENLTYIVSNQTDIPLPVEMAVYYWIYADAGSNWSHRHTSLWYPYNDNSCLSGREGVLGIGRASGGPYQGPYPVEWEYAEIIVMNVFDPCSTWDLDCDEIPNDEDNCPNTSNNLQENNDNDSHGDACDNCPTSDNEDQSNFDGDLFGDVCDNCPDDSNPKQEDGDCDGIGNVCDELTDCTEGEDCDNDCDGLYNQNDNCPNDGNPNQEDTYPPQGNGIGDACDCEADFNCAGGVAAEDVTEFLNHFGRSQYNQPCSICISGSGIPPTNFCQTDVDCGQGGNCGPDPVNPCNGDFSCDGAVDANDVLKFLEDFGRSQYNNPCPACVAGDWCVY